MNIHLDRTENTQNAILTLSGDMTVEHAAKLCSALKEAAEDQLDVDVQIGETGSVDMTFFQLMCSAHRTFTLQGKRFVLKQGKNDILAKGAASGFVRHKGCSRDKFHTCAMVMEN